MNLQAIQPTPSPRTRLMSAFLHALSLAFLVLYCESAAAANFVWPDRATIRIVGEIQPGDAERFVQELTQGHKSSNDVRPLFEVELDSRGGDVDEALRIAQVIDALFVQTSVAKGKICASSCFFLYLEGIVRRAAPLRLVQRDPMNFNGALAIHRPYLASQPSHPSQFQKAESVAGDVASATQVYLSKKLVPQYLIERMMQRPSNEAYFLSEDDLRQVGRYKPGFEELLVTHCGYVRELEEEYFFPPENLSKERLASLEKQSDKVLDCYYTKLLEPFVWHERPRVIQRLRSGWRPWNTDGKPVRR